MRSVRVFVVLTAFLLMVSGCADLQYRASDRENTLILLHTNDHHGHPLAFFDYPCPGQGGLPARATLVHQVREQTANVLVVDAGDINTGRSESNFFKAEPDIEGYNYIRYDAMTIGNHEFDMNWEDMQSQIAMSQFPWLCANAKRNGMPLKNIVPYIIKSYDGFKVAIFGLLTRETQVIGNPKHIKGIEFEDEVKTAAALVPLLREKADIVIAIVHMGIYENESKGSKRLAAKVPGIALIVDGHTHTTMDQPVFVKNEITGKQVPIVQAKNWGLFVGEAELRFKAGEVTGFSWQAIPINVQKKIKNNGKEICLPVDRELKEDPQLLSLLQPYAAKVDIELSEKVGYADKPFFNDDSRNRETPLGDIVADSQLWYMEKIGIHVDFAFQNGGGIRATLDSGDIKRKNIYEILPFDNSITLVALKGSDVISLFDQAAGKIGKGAMPQVSDGVSLTIDARQKKVQNLTIKGKAVDPAKVYKIAVNSYLAAGGDDYKVFLKRLDFFDSSYMQRDAFVDYLVSKDGNISPVSHNRITIE